MAGNKPGPKSKKEKADDLVREVQEKLKIASDAENDIRKAHIEDTKFENGQQWDQTAERDRENHGRPALVINKVAGVVKQIVGNMRQNNMAIKVRPVDDVADPQTAEILTGLIRNIENVSNAQAAYDCAGENAIRGNLGYFRIITDYAADDSFDQDILIKRIVNPLSVYLDPSATEADRSDAKWCVITTTMSKDQFKSDYPSKRYGYGLDAGKGERYSDWFAEDTVKVAEYFKVKYENKTLLLLKDGRTVIAEDLDDDAKIAKAAADDLRAQGFVERERTSKMPCIMWWKVTGVEILEGPKKWAGKYIPVVPVLGEEVFIEGKLYLRSAIKWAKEPAMLYNFARSNMAETLALAPKQPFIGTSEQFEGHELEWDTANTNPRSRLTYTAVDNAPPPARQPASIQDTGAMTEAQVSDDDIRFASGMNSPSLGAAAPESSGKAILARQAQGDTATFVFQDNLANAIGYAGKILVDLIPKIYDTERVVRLLGPDGSEGWAKINAEDPVTGAKANDITIGKYDVVVNAGPAYTTKRLEAADSMANLLQSAPNYAPTIMPRLAKNLDWPEADEIAKEMQAMNPANQQQQGPSPEQQAEMAKAKMEMEGKRLDNQGKQLENQKKAIELQEEKVGTEEHVAAVVIKSLKQLNILPDET